MAGFFDNLEKLEFGPSYGAKTLANAITENRKKINELIDIINKEVTRSKRYNGPSL